MFVLYLQGEALRQSLLTRYYGKEHPRAHRDSIHEAPGPAKSSHTSGGPGSVMLSRAEMTLSAVQCHLDKEGASDLVVDLIINNHSNRIFLETVELGIALLEGGNSVIQKSFFVRVTMDKNSEKFFKVFFDRMRAAQAEIKATVTVNTSDQFQVGKKHLEGHGHGHQHGHGHHKEEHAHKNGKPNGVLVNNELKEQMDEASDTTGKALANVRHSRGGSVGADDQAQHQVMSIDDMIADKNKEKDDEKPTMSPEIAMMQPILRFLQLLCENHNRDLQNFLRNQQQKNSFNLVCETLQFLDCICGSTTGGLGLLGLYINEGNVALINQTLESLTEYCQGPCHENQNAIATHESNGIDIIIALILNDINPLGKQRMDLVLELKNNASKLLLAIMESRHDSENAERILYNMSPKQLVDVCKQAFYQDNSDEAEIDDEDEEDEEEGASPKDVGHNIYILAHQLAQHNQDLAELLKPGNGDATGDQALEYYAKHTAQIEIVRHDRTMEQIVFPIPEICEYLTEETKTKLYVTAERDDQGSKVTDFFEQVDDLFAEMKWQKKLRASPVLFWFSSHMFLWSSITFNLAVLVNLIVAFFYPFDENKTEISPRLSLLIWTSMLVSLAIVITLPRPSGIWTLTACIILRMIFSIGVEPTLWIIGILNITNKTVYLISLMGNRGTFTKSFMAILTDFEFMYHSMYYLGLCICAMFIHEFFYSLLLLDIVYQEETLLNVIKSVTRNSRSLLLTAVLAVIIIYIFSIIGFIFFKEDFQMEVDILESTGIDKNVVEAATTVAATAGATAGTCMANKSCPPSKPTGPEVPEKNHSDTLQDAVNKTEKIISDLAAHDDDPEKEDHCSTLIMCILTSLNEGLRNGGGIGDILRKPSVDESLFMARVVYDLLFFFIVIIIILNLIFGVIIDTFADLRSEKQQKEEILKNTCFICGLDRGSFDNKSVSFEEHIRTEHNMWHYLYFIVLVKVKDPTEFTGPESYVYAMVNNKNLDWFPRMRAMSLAADDGEGEQNELRNFQAQLESTNKLVLTLSGQLSELKDQMQEQRKQKQRIGLLNTPSLPVMANSN
ncbi:unnamed protein product [Owenia fusiformis]|uniref:Inositol 1,4,5-trisphosphate receptor type 1 n=1 Tax=Owenia fusiformis TaxID=6347 RepID=A0A8S4NQ49_OWEFU|nr:unnamed protein product [Owenia fusiformis]